MAKMVHTRPNLKQSMFPPTHDAAGPDNTSLSVVRKNSTNAPTIVSARQTQIAQVPTQTSPAQEITTARASSEQLKSLQKPQDPDKAFFQQNRTLILIGIISFVATLVIAQKFTSLREPSLRSDYVTPDQLEKASGIDFDSIDGRLDYHKSKTGQDMNRERIKTELSNIKSAPPLNPHTEKNQLNDPVLFGVPLQSEGLPKIPSSITVRTTHPAAQYPDVEITRGLAEQQQENERLQLEQKQQIKDFVRAAEAEGWRIKIDKDLNVEAERPITDEDINEAKEDLRRRRVRH